MTRTTTLPAWLVAAMFAPTALLLWLIGFGRIPLHPDAVPAAFQAISLAQLLLGFVLLEQFTRIGASGPPPLGSGLLLALGVFLVAEIAYSAAARRGWGGAGDSLALTTLLVQQVVVIGLAEELWFRGLWMRATAWRPGIAVFGGAAGFGIYHLHQGWEVMITATALGLLLGTARWHGVPVWGLAVAHGFFNWTGGILLPGLEWRFDPVASRFLHVVLLLARIATTTVLRTISAPPSPAPAPRTTPRTTLVASPPATAARTWPL